MPILDIEIVIRPGETLDHKVAVELANRQAKYLLPLLVQLG